MFHLDRGKGIVVMITMFKLNVDGNFQPEHYKLHKDTEVLANSEDG